ncbi:Asp-tRNA(Asn)/Glu-tRNA(Gln) amidotransferase subunit GatB, partial [Candidatus Uhrbacteria bacterium]|nr:Asp-tRNA(Asn)/Glu-tRNA(Gln) amidotransferase subunit GatB [Candidatus Uhrbacteria bacterium]
DGQVEMRDPDNGDMLSVRIERAHLEEDAAKNVHRDSATFVDFNRAGTPLVEIVTKPDFRNPQDAKFFLQELRRILRYLRVSDADMEKGHMRCDANVSLRPVDARGLPVLREFYPKTEVKNMNSFKAVERALEYEIKRQTDLWNTNSPPAQTTTRGWNDRKQTTELQRVKEAEADYRYMREPDIPQISVTDALEEERHALPELPDAARARFRDEYGFAEQAVWTLTDDPEMAAFTEAAMTELTGWLVASPDTQGSAEEIREKHRAPIAKLAGTWLATKLLGLLSERGASLSETSLTPENMAELLRLLFEQKVNSAHAQTMLGRMLDDGSSPEQLLSSQQFSRMDDAAALRDIVEHVLARHPQQVNEYKAGKQSLLAFFIGLVQKETNGSADPHLTKQLLESLLS